jgi:hypothetical protein
MVILLALIVGFGATFFYMSSGNLRSETAPTNQHPEADVSLKAEDEKASPLEDTRYFDNDESFFPEVDDLTFITLVITMLPKTDKNVAIMVAKAFNLNCYSTDKVGLLCGKFLEDKESSVFSASFKDNIVNRTSYKKEIKNNREYFKKVNFYMANEIINKFGQPLKVTYPTESNDEYMLLFYDNETGSYLAYFCTLDDKFDDSILIMISHPELESIF